LGQRQKAAYILYLVLILFQLITGDYDWAIANMGIALDFDPASFIEESFMFAFYISGTSFYLLQEQKK